MTDTITIDLDDIRPTLRDELVDVLTREYETHVEPDSLWALELRIMLRKLNDLDV